MAEEKQKRSSVEVQTEYAKLCGILGDKSHRVKQQDHEIDQIHIALHNLNIEYAEAIKREEEEKKGGAASGGTVSDADIPDESPT